MMFGTYFLLGAFVGTLSGMIGIGGGVIVVPALAAIFLHLGNVPNDAIMHYAMGTSLAVIVFSLTSSMYAHHQRGAVEWDSVVKMVPGLCLGAICGAMVAHFLPSSFLRVFFGMFLMAVALHILLSKHQKITKKYFSQPIYWSISFTIGVLSSILGVGGGILLVPFLLRAGLETKHAVGTSVVCALVVSFIATLSYMVTGLFSHVHIPWSTGYIYWPAWFSITIAGVIFAPFGAAISHKMPALLLKRIFGICLLIVAADMLI